MNSSLLLISCRILLLASVLLLRLASHAQTCVPVYHKIYSAGQNDEALFILGTSDKGAIISGRTTSSNTGSYDGLLMKVAQDGTVQWSNSYGGADYDEITKTASTSDGGYISLGMTKSFTNAFGQPFLLKTNSTGTLQWSMILFTGTAGREQPKDILVLSDGSYVVLINQNDSTPQGDAIVYRVSSTGTLIWAKSFDHGNEDGFNTVAEVADSLMVGGFATIDGHDAIYMNISKANGNVYWARKYLEVLTLSGVHDEILRIENIPGGVNVISTALMRLGTNSSYHLGTFKRRNDGTIYDQVMSDVTSGYGGPYPRSVVPHLATDGEYAYFMVDSLPSGWSELVKMNNGLSWWGRQLWRFGPQYARMTGLDTAEKRGYWATGYSRVIFANNKIELFKLDNGGYAAGCAPMTNGDFTNLRDYTNTPFTWNSVTNISPAIVAISPTVMALSFTPTALCDSLYCDLQPTINDSCKSTFLLHLRSYDRVSLHDVEPTLDGGTIAVGSLATNSFLMKMRSDGTVEWSKNYNRFFRYMSLNRIISTNDGNYLIIGHSNLSFNNGSATKTVLLKVDNAGNVIWNKEYDFSGQLELHNVISTPDGGFIVCGNRGGGALDSYVMRLSSTGVIMWQKTTQLITWQPFYKQIYLQGDELYLLADTYYRGDVMRLERWNASSGQLLWSRTISRSTGKVYSGLVTKIGDTIYTVSHVFTDAVYVFTTDVHVVVAKFDASGNYLGNYRLSTPIHSPEPYDYVDNSPFLPFCFALTPDSNFVVAQQTRSSAAGQKLAITKFSPTGNIIWAREFPNLPVHLVSTVKNQGNNLLIGGRIKLNSGSHFNVFTSFIMKTDLNGLIREDAVGLCQSDASTSTKDTDPNFNQDLDGTVSVQNSTCTVNDVVLTIKPIELEGELQCSLASVCSVVNLVGPTSTCSLTDTITYTLNKNPGCNSPAAWMADTSIVKIISSNDSVLRIIPKRIGLVKISASLQTGCTGLTKEIFLNIGKAAATVHLGPDTSICAGNTIKLRAAPGFASYVWQDGSTDSTLVVNAPGTYYVQVIDSCGNIGADTILVSPQAPIPFYAGPDRTKCNNDTLHLNAPAGFLNYTWSNNYNISSLTNQNVVVYPLVDTTYYVRAEKTPGCFAFDTIHINVYQSPAIQLGNDASFCSGDSLVLDAGSGFMLYQWSNGNTSQLLTVKSPGSYRVMGTTTEGCKSYDTLQVLNVWQNPIVSLDPNTGLCDQSTRTLDAGAFSSYLWQDGSTNRTFTVNSLGDYFVRVTDSRNCIGYDTVHIQTILPLPSGFLPADTAVCAYATLILAPNKNFLSYAWNTGSTNKTISVSQSGLYWLQVKDNNNCNGKDSIIVLPKDCLKGVFIPNAFTPNKNGKNDAFRALVNGPIKSFELTVYNRWGQLVFQTREWSKGWDGTLSGHALASDSFVWMCRYQFEGEEEKVEKGTVMLIR